MCIDIPHAFIQTPSENSKENETVVIKITGVLVDIIVEDRPFIYDAYVVYEGTMKVLYVEVLRSI